MKSQFTAFTLAPPVSVQTSTCDHNQLNSTHSHTEGDAAVRAVSLVAGAHGGEVEGVGACPPRGAAEEPPPRALHVRERRSKKTTSRRQQGSVSFLLSLFLMGPLAISYESHIY